MASKIKKAPMDGNNAATHCAYALSDCAVIYPITPSSAMGEMADEWAAQGKKNIYDQVLMVTEMQSEAGAAGALHGALSAGSLGVTFTASQGLLLMIPNMYKIAGEKMPAVFHVSARAIAGQALSIFGDHSDVMACRQTGFALLSSHTVQEAMDMALVSHLAAHQSSLPFLHFFDGFRTSHEVQKVEVIPYETIASLVDHEAIARFRARALNPEHPQMRGTSQCPDIFFQLVESSNPDYLRLPEIVQQTMDRVAAAIGRQYHLFDYHGAPDATEVVVVMGAGGPTMEEAADYLNAHGAKVGVIRVHLYRPFSARHFLQALPASTRKICVLDRTKEPGSHGEPLFLDIAAVLHEAGMHIPIVGGRYGLGSKDFTASMAKAVFDNLHSDAPKVRFTVGLTDDVTNLSLPVTELINAVPEGTHQALIWGLGSDGTVGANKEAIKMIGKYTPLYCQGYFEYDAKKSGGLTRSHLRFGPVPIKSCYYVDYADYIGCHHPAYVTRYDLLKSAHEGTVFVLNSPWTAEQMEHHLSNRVKRDLARLHCRFFNIDAFAVAERSGLKPINMIMQTVFFKLAEVMPIEEAIAHLKEGVHKAYGKKGEAIVNANCNAIDNALAGLAEIPVPPEWASLTPEPPVRIEGAPDFVNDIMLPVSTYRGDELPISTLNMCPGGIMPTSTSQWEKRGLATHVPVWDAGRCIQCCQCSLCCPHAVIRPFLLTDEEIAAAPCPETFLAPATKLRQLSQFKFRIQISPLDCTGCGVCAQVCPAKPEKALVMRPIESTLPQEAEHWRYVVRLPVRGSELLPPNMIQATQLRQPLLEFSGACAGCGETPYIKLITQLFGDRMIVANATGCSSIWGGSAPWCPYTVNAQGHGPAWANSLFEDNAEYGYGMALSTLTRRNKLADLCAQALAAECTPDELKAALQRWLAGKDNAEESRAAGEALKPLLQAQDCPLCREILASADMFTKKSQWIFGGDGWAYDIGYGGLDHVLAMGEDLNVVVLDTEVYSNTGGQRSKATPRASAAKFAFSGKKTGKKDLGLLAMSYGNVYVACCSLGANPAQYVRAIREAESYPGPSLIICYAPCIAHGIQGGMAMSIQEEKLAVEHGYWQLYRYDPRLIAEAKNPFQLDSKAPTGDLKTFLNREVRFSSLKPLFPEEAERLQNLLVEDRTRTLNTYKALSENSF